ncbi:PorV/PorQ family protein [candidate division FCPU426 bacterium]|nr:PorV/PorQ family protein [candidate division FCPU426 bacterium]
MKKIIVGLILAALACPQPATAGARDANAFLSVGPGAEAAGMAESYAALAGGAFGAAYNPAGLGQIPGLTLGVQHNEWFAGMRMDYLSAILPFGPGSLSAALNYFTYGSLDVRDQDGYLTGRSFQPYDLAFSGGYGWQVADQWLAGAALTITQGYIMDFSDSGLGATLGGMWTSPWEGVAVACVFKNLGYNLSKYTWPMRAVLAVSSKDRLAKGLSANLELDLPLVSGFTELALGVQYTLLRTVSFRGGYRYAFGEGEASLAGLALGLGVELSRIDISYALRPMGDFGLTHRLSVSYAFPPMLVPLGKIEDQALAHYKRGQGLEKEEDWLGALVEYRVALNFQPDWKEVDVALRRVSHKIEAAADKQRKAEIARARAAEPSPEQIRAEEQLKRITEKHFRQGEAYLTDKKYRAAVREWELILEFVPDHTQAKENIKKTVKIMMVERDALHKKALQARKDKNHNLEMQYWRQALDLSPDDQVAMEYLYMGTIEQEAVEDKKQEEKKQEQKKKISW